MSIAEILMPHQHETIDYGLKNPYFIMALPPGLGKTICAIEIVERLKKKFNRDINVLYICPASVKLNIKDEILKWYPHLQISCFMSKKDFYELWATDYAIINYEMIKDAESLFKWADIVIVDEAHLAKNTEAQRSDKLHEFIYKYELRRVMLLTGTPMANNVSDFYSLLAICYYNPRFKDEPEFLQKFPTFIDFAEYFCNRVEFRNDYGMKVKYEGVKNVKELKAYLKNIYISFDADKVLKIEKGVDKHIQVKELNNEKILKDFETFVASDVGQTISSKAKKEAAMAMTDATIEYVKLLMSTGVEEVVVFSDHIDSAKKIAEAFGTVAMTSHMTEMQDRRDLVKSFQEGKSKVIVGSGVMGVSWTLTRANNLVINDYPWRPGDLDQLLRRIRRVCQKRTPFYHYMHGSFQSRYILKLLYKKMEDIGKVLN